MNQTHIEVANSKGFHGVENGQLLKVIRETPCFIWVKGFNGVEYKVSKQTKRINGTERSFIRTANQPQMNF